MNVSKAEPEHADSFVRADGLLPGAASAVGYATTGPVLPIHRGLPSPYLTFIITLNEPVVGGFSAEQATGPDAIANDIVAAGLHDRPAYIAQRDGQAGIQLALYPLAARQLFGMPAAELAGHIPDGAAVIGRSIIQLREQVIAARDWSARFGLVGDFFRRRATHSAGGSQPRPEVIEAWRWLTRMRGAGSISALANHVGLSRRQLQAVFTAEFGAGPATFKRLLRFQRALRMITDRVDREQPLDLADIASSCGYFDQSHLNRDFRSLTGTSPTGWLAEELGNVLAGGHRNGDDACSRTPGDRRKIQANPGL